jgi:hypothetical protein
MFPDASRALLGVTWKECPYDAMPRMIWWAGKPALDQAFTADIAEPSCEGAHESSKGLLGPTEGDEGPQTS